MRKLFVVAVLLGIFFVTSVLAEDSATDCNSAMSVATSLNAYELWRGANSCGKSKDMVRATFLLLAGQIRGLTDIAVLLPASDEDTVKASKLARVFRYQAGGSGDDEVLRDIAQTDHLFDELRNWRPTLDETYDPGWSYTISEDTELYQNMIACQREKRIARLKSYAGLVRNDEYFKASNDLNALRAANPGPTTVGAALHDEMQAIMARMSANWSDVSMHTEQPSECDFALEYRGEPDPDFAQAFTGANGPGSNRANVFKSVDEVLSSWIAIALSADELGKILSEVDFDQQILVSLTFGKRRNATGVVYLSEVIYNSVYESLHVSGFIGVTDSECDIAHSDSFPFVLGIAPRPEKVPTFPSMSHLNFDDGCKSIMKGTQSVVTE